MVNSEKLEEKLKEYLLKNIGTIKDVVLELNSYSNCLEWLDFLENDEDFFDTYFEGKPMEAARAAFYGDYNFSDDFVRFNAYGNLEGCTEWEYEAKLEESIDDIIDALLEYKDNIYIYDTELENILEEE